MDGYQFKEKNYILIELKDIKVNSRNKFVQH